MSYLCIVHVVHLVEDHEFDISNKVGALIQHATQNFRCHDKTIGFWVDLNVTRQDAHGSGPIRLLEVAVLLV